MSALLNYSRQLFRAHHRSPYARVLVLAVVIHFMLFVFSPPFEFKPYQLAQAEPPMEVMVIDDIVIPPPPAEVPLPPSEIVPATGVVEEVPLPPTLGLDVFNIPFATTPRTEKPDEFYPFDEAPVPLKLQAPKYPPLAREAGIEGVVKVKVLIGRDGLVKKASIMESNVTKDMERAAIEAARQCRFKPGKQQTKPVPVTVVIPFHFKLDNCK